MKRFWWEVFTDNGVGSFAYVMTAVVLMFLMLWDTYIVFWTKIVPGLADQALFLGVLYGVKKAANVVTSYSGKPNDGSPANQPQTGDNK